MHTITYLRGLEAADLLDQTPVDDLPNPWTDSLVFDHFQAAYGIELWPLPEVSHRQFLADHDHAEWLQRFNDLAVTLTVINLDRPWGIDRIPAPARAAREYDYVAVCDVCGSRLKPRATVDAAHDHAGQHAHVAHRWIARRTGASR